MAVGPFARILAQVVVPVVAVLARALPAAYAQALQNARKSGVNAAETAAPIFRKKISQSEALQVLNLTEKEAASAETVQKVSGVRSFSLESIFEKGKRTWDYLIWFYFLHSFVPSVL